jgi:glutaredoxin
MAKIEAYSKEWCPYCANAALGAFEYLVTQH